VKKAILLGVASFALSMAATTSILVKRYNPVVTLDSLDAHPTQAVPDSEPGKAPAGDTLSADTAARDTVPGRDSSSAVAAAAAGNTEPPSGAPPHRGPARPAEDPAARAAAFKQVARVLSAMKPPEAAKVLALMTDQEVEGILRSVGPRQAADFLTNLPKERAATLSRRLLVPQGDGESR
jgi:hypothetical protein